MMRARRAGLGAVALALAVTSAMSACGAKVAPAVGAEAARAALIEHMRAFVDAPARTSPWFRDLHDLLPNVEYEVGGQAPVALTDLVVVGGVVDVQPGIGGKPGVNDSPPWVRTAFDDPDAWARTVHLTVQVEEVIGSPAAAPTVTFGLSVGAATEISFDQVVAGMKSLGTVVVFLYEDSPVLSYDPSLLAVYYDGGMFATIDEAGNLALPFMPPGTARALLAETPTLAVLRDHGDAPTVTPLEIRDGIPVRTN